jgi:hypothetical protein
MKISPPKLHYDTIYKVITIVEEICQVKKTTVVLVATGLLALSGCSIAPKSLSLDESANITTSPVFDNLNKIPEGWQQEPIAPPAAGEESQASATLKKHPLAIYNADKTCSFTQSIGYLPSYQANRGDDYLSKDAVYQQAASGDKLVDKVTTYNVNSNRGLVQFAYASYDLPTNAMPMAGTPAADALKSGKDKSRTYRVTAVRAFDKTLATGFPLADNAPAGPFGTDASKGLPTVSLIYSCTTQSAFNEDDAKKLIDQARISLS